MIDNTCKEVIIMSQMKCIKWIATVLFALKDIICIERY